MEGYIDQDGGLWIKRKTRVKRMRCPFSFTSSRIAFCGDECPLFSDPQQEGGKITLNLCMKTLSFTKKGFKDMRK